MPVSPSDDYTHSKLVKETIVLQAGGAVVRLSNLFGRGMSARNVLSDILSQISSKGPIFIRDDKPVRDFLHVNDAAMAMSSLVENDYTGLLNVGSGVGTGIGELAELVLNVVGQNSRSIIPTNPSDGHSRNILDISETTERLGWKPMGTLADGLRDLAAGPSGYLR
jgi:UDP-glucose 4-epimerase